MAIVDANYILRYLLDDIEEQSHIATQVIEGTPVKILNEVVAEVVYVLQKVYEVDRESISNSILMIIKFDNVESEYKKVLKVALEKYSETKFDFVDCLLYGMNTVDDEEIYTFDKKLNKLLGR